MPARRYGHGLNTTIEHSSVLYHGTKFATTRVKVGALCHNTPKSSHILKFSVTVIATAALTSRTHGHSLLLLFNTCTVIIAPRCPILYVQYSSSSTYEYELLFHLPVQSGQKAGLVVQGSFSKQQRLYLYCCTCTDLSSVLLLHNSYKQCKYILTSGECRPSM